MITTSTDDLTVALDANGGAAMITTSTDDLADDLAVAPNISGVCRAR